MLISFPGVSRLGIDTNILLRWTKKSDVSHPLVTDSVSLLATSGVKLYVTPQNIAEFWNVCTRPIENNGFSFSTDRANDEVARIESEFEVLDENKTAYVIWRRLVVETRVVGVQVHDARLAALYRAHSISHLLTFNARDFVRFGITPIAPQAVLENS